MSTAALARSTDPVESHIAAASVDTTPLEDRVLFALASRPMTDASDRRLPRSVARDRLSASRASPSQGKGAALRADR